MIIQPDLHMHSEFSHDSHLTLKEIAEVADVLGLSQIGITDHVNLNDEFFLGNAKMSAENIKEFQKSYPKMHLGVELTPIEKPQFEYIAKNKTSDGYVAPETSSPFEIELASALRENGKYVECNSGVICSPIASKKFKYQYAEFLRELFEMGIPVTYGSDAHNIYQPPIEMTEKYLIAAGFRDGDIVGI